MRPDPHLHRWLAAEAAGDDAAAERALGGLLRRVPRREPSPGFVARVLVAAGLAPAAAPAAAPARWLRAAAILGALLVGPTLLLLLPLAALAPRVAEVGTATPVALAADLLAGLGAWLAEGLRFWDALAGFARLARVVAGSGPGLALVASCLLTVLVTSRLLVGIALPERSALHVRP